MQCVALCCTACCSVQCVAVSNKCRSLLFDESVIIQCVAVGVAVCVAVGVAVDVAVGVAVRSLFFYADGDEGVVLPMSHV